ncbi:MAG: hypothetical protein K0Q90_1288 [Paenibacillaceae bacterium]|nr:hypothetical protein [Paenibacillaceae bacterium]
MKHRKIRILAAALILTLAGAGAVYAFIGTEQESIRIAQVNGMNVSGMEFKRELDRQRASVIDYFHRTYGARFTESFWTTSYAAENPETVAKAQALEELVKRKVELELASSFGLLSGASYENLLEELEKENKRRAEAVKARLPVYGPVNMDESVFIPYYMSKLRNELKERLTADDLGVTEERLLRLKALERNPAPPEADRVRFQKLAAAYRNTGDDSASVREGPVSPGAAESLSSLKQRLEKAAQEMLPSGEWRSTPDSYAAAGIQVTEEELTGETAGIYFKSQPVLYTVLTGGLKEGQASPVFDEALQGQLVLVKVLKRDGPDPGSGNDGEAAEQQESLGALYQRYVERLASEAEVTVFSDSYNRLTIK